MRLAFVGVGSFGVVCVGVVAVCVCCLCLSVCLYRSVCMCVEVQYVKKCEGRWCATNPAWTCTEERRVLCCVVPCVLCCVVTRGQQSSIKRAVKQVVVARSLPVGGHAQRKFPVRRGGAVTRRCACVFVKNVRAIVTRRKSYGATQRTSPCLWRTTRGAISFRRASEGWADRANTF